MAIAKKRLAIRSKTDCVHRVGMLPTRLSALLSRFGLAQGKEGEMEILSVEQMQQEAERIARANGHKLGSWRAIGCFASHCECGAFVVVKVGDTAPSGTALDSNPDKRCPLATSEIGKEKPPEKPPLVFGPDPLESRMDYSMGDDGAPRLFVRE